MDHVELCVSEVEMLARVVETDAGRVAQCLDRDRFTGRVDERRRQCEGISRDRDVVPHCVERRGTADKLERIACELEAVRSRDAHRAARHHRTDEGRHVTGQLLEAFRRERTTKRRVVRRRDQYVTQLRRRTDIARDRDVARAGRQRQVFGLIGRAVNCPRDGDARTAADRIGPPRNAVRQHHRPGDRDRSAIGRDVGRRRQLPNDHRQPANSRCDVGRSGERRHATRCHRHAVVSVQSRAGVDVRRRIQVHIATRIDRSRDVDVGGSGHERDVAPGRHIVRDTQIPDARHENVGPRREVVGRRERPTDSRRDIPERRRDGTLQQHVAARSERHVVTSRQCLRGGKACSRSRRKIIARVNRGRDDGESRRVERHVIDRMDYRTDRDGSRR